MVLKVGVAFSSTEERQNVIRLYIRLCSSMDSVTVCIYANRYKYKKHAISKANDYALSTGNLQIR